MLRGRITTKTMKNYAHITKDEAKRIIEKNAEKVIKKEDYITEDTRIDMRAGAFFDGEHLVSFEILYSDDYIYDWEQIHHYRDSVSAASDPMTLVKMKGLQKLYELTWEEIQEITDSKI